jgi:hypothetical protein
MNAQPVVGNALEADSPVVDVSHVAALTAGRKSVLGLGSLIGEIHGASAQAITIYEYAA